MIVLILMLPLYSASSLAATVQITRNEGLAGVEGFLEAEGDTYTVEALVTGAGEVLVQDMTMEIAGTPDDFTECTQEGAGTLCSYVSQLESIPEGIYPIKVIFDNGAESGQRASEVVVDGSGPRITGFVFEQSPSLFFDFVAQDHARISTIQVQSSTGEIIFSFAPDQQTFIFRDQGLTSEQVFLAFANVFEESLETLRIVATDSLGHSTSQAFGPIDVDFMKPRIIDDSLTFPKFGRFIGQSVTRSDVRISIRDKNLESVTGLSETIGINNHPADCELDDNENNLFHCTWENVDIQPQTLHTISVVASDEFGNVEEKTVRSPTFIPDTSPPRVEFFGTENQFEGKSFVRSGRQRITLIVNEEGAGLNSTGISANMAALGGQSNAQPECEATGNQLECFWNSARTFAADGIARIQLTKLQDNVGNKGELAEVELVMDSSGPKVEKLAAFGGQNDHFTSGDQLRLELSVSENNGVVIVVNGDKLILDAKNEFPENRLTRGLGDGWVAFENACQPGEAGKFRCQVQTPPIKSGPDFGVPLEIKVRDTAGNDAVSWPETALNLNQGSHGSYFIDIKGLSDEANPDYWEVSGVDAQGGSKPFVDLDTAELTHARQSFKINLRPGSNSARALRIDLSPCQADVEAAPAISREILIGGITPEGSQNPTPTLILEFEPFNGIELFNLEEDGGENFERHFVDYTCSARILSEVGGNALANVEIQEIKIPVPFGFSDLGAPDANLEEEIKKARDEATSGIWAVVGTVESVMRWVRYIGNIVNIISSAIGVVEAVKGGTDAFKAFPPAEGARIATCFGLNSATKATSTTLNTIQIPLNILSCRPTGSKTTFKWYDDWLNFIPQYYNSFMNIEGLASPDAPPVQFKPARSVEDNLYLSMAALCPTGIIKNLDKFRQIKCRKIYCLENDVKSGLATVNTCNELEGLLTCKYFIGELWYILPFGQFYDTIIGALKNAWRDPLALAHTVNVLACGTSCLVSSSSSSVCNFTFWLWDVIGVIESTIGFVTTISADLKSEGGLQYCDSVL